jgi:hypothetical protein
MQGFLEGFYPIIKRMGGKWQKLAAQVSHVDKAGADPLQMLLDVLALHPGSVEYHQRYAQSLNQLFNRLNLAGLGPDFDAAVQTVIEHADTQGLLQTLVDGRLDRPTILNIFFLNNQHLLSGPVVDDRPLSETDPIRAYTKSETKKGDNYIAWLSNAVNTSLDDLRQQNGFKDDKPPNALLYIYLRHALLLAYWESHLNFIETKKPNLSKELLAKQREAAFIHVKSDGKVSESRWASLYSPDKEITGKPKVLLHDFMTALLKQVQVPNEMAAFAEQLKAIDALKDSPTARLERVFAEHIDTCSYRLDAWQLGFVRHQLAAMRDKKKQGVYLGAYGWLEDVRPRSVAMVAANQNDLQRQIFGPVQHDPSNQGYIHAPSLNQAVTAAVLRNGYLSNASPGNPQALAVNLSSERVRMALDVIEGIRAGQSLGALLGYQLERGLHDRYSVAEMDQFILTLRRAFPLQATHINTSTDTVADSTPIEALEARNVIDGYALVNHIKNSPGQSFPWGLQQLSVPRPNEAQVTALSNEVDRIMNIADAVADLAVAEGVHQVLQGNYDRAGATFDAYSKAGTPPIPDVVRTPRSGIALTHRVGLHLTPVVGTPVSPLAGIDLTPRATCEPALNQWLKDCLPNPNLVGCHVLIDNPPPTNVTVTWADLQLQPIDLLYLLHQESEQAMSELDDRVLRHVIKTNSFRPDQEVKIEYATPLSGKVTFFELSSLVRNLRALLLRSRPLQPGDLSLHNEASQSSQVGSSINPARINAVSKALDELRKDLDKLAKEIIDPSQTTKVLPKVDGWINELRELCVRASGFGLPQTGWGFLYAWKQGIFKSVSKQTNEVVQRWKDRLGRHDALISQYIDLGSNDEKFDLLTRAELLISSRITSRSNRPLDELKNAIKQKRDLFENKLNDLIAVSKSNTNSVNELRSSLEKVIASTGEPPRSWADFDLQPFDFSEFDRSLVTFTFDLQQFAIGLQKEVTNRLEDMKKHLDAHTASSSPLAQVQALTKAAKAVFGEDFLIVPEFKLAADSRQAREWQSCHTDSSNGSLLRHQTATLKIDFPVDNWLYGLARVREKMRHLEQVLVLCDAFNTSAPTLMPVQFPYKANDHWLGMEYPENYIIDGDHLLYTAHYPGGALTADGTHCGLLIDEWTEVIPAKEENTGVAFHHDRPNSEPPQTMLLVTPPKLTGMWTWDDLVDALNETLDLAKARAVEPDHLDHEAISHFLPATLMAVSLYPITIASNLGVNNDVYEAVSADGQ